MRPDDHLDCLLAVQVDDALRGPFRAPAYEELWIGRADDNGLHVPEVSISRRQARILWTEHAWLLENGERTRMQVQSPWLDQVHVAPRGMIVLQPGETFIAWPELDIRFDLIVKVGPRIAEEFEPLRNPPGAGQPALGTDLAAHRVRLSDDDRRVLAAYYRPLLDGSEPPRNVAVAVASLLGVSEQSVKNRIERIRTRVNRDRWQKLKTADQMGEYLVRTTRTLGPEDLAGLPG